MPGNAAAASALLRLYELTGDAQYATSAAALSSALAESAASYPSAFGELWNALDFQTGAREVVIVQPDDGKRNELDAMLAPARRGLGITRVLAVTSESAARGELSTTLPIVKGKRAIGGAVTAYVCENRVCARPTSDPAVFAKQLGIEAD